jgi:hypothetical protein
MCASDYCAKESISVMLNSLLLFPVELTAPL